MSVRIPIHPSYVLSSGYMETTTLDGAPVSLLKDNGTKHTSTIKLDHLGLPPSGVAILTEDPVLVTYYNKDKYNIATTQYFPDNYLITGSFSIGGDIHLHQGKIKNNEDILLFPIGNVGITTTILVVGNIHSTPGSKIKVKNIIGEPND